MAYILLDDKDYPTTENHKLEPTLSSLKGRRCLYGKRSDLREDIRY